MPSFISKLRFLFATAACVLGVGTAIGQQKPAYVEGDVIVTFKAGGTLAKAQGSLKKQALRMKRHFPGLSKHRGKHTALVQDKAKTTAQLIQALKADPDVETAEPNYLRYTFSTPNDAFFSSLWGLQNSGQPVNGTAGNAGADIRYLDAWDRSRASAQAPVVAVIDTGVNHTHPDLAGSMWTNPGEVPGNNLDDDGNGLKDDIHGYDFASNVADPFDVAGHGSHVAGVIAAQGRNGTGVIGVQPKAKIMALKVADAQRNLSSAAIIAALDYVVDMKNRGINIVAINASYGGAGSTVFERDAIDEARGVGIIFVAAAGNNAEDNDSVNVYPANYRLGNMIVVAATAQNDTLSTFSNYGGTNVDMGAPGSDILSTVPASGIGEVVVNGETYPAGFMTESPQVAFNGPLIFCGIGNPADFPSTVSGKVALIERGGIQANGNPEFFFRIKVTNAMAAGAIGAVIYNNVEGDFLGTLVNPGTWIPAVSISRKAGLAIKDALPQNVQVNVVNSGYQFLDGTSMAAPHVAGGVAFAAMCFPTESLISRRLRILRAVDLKPALAGKTTTGGRFNLLRVIDRDLNGVQSWSYITKGPDLTGAVVGTAYSETVTAAGGGGTRTFEVVDGTLPAGVTMSSAGVISGTSTTAGTATFSVRVSDGNGAGATRELTLVTAATAPSFITGSTLPSGAVGQDYSTSFATEGGTGPYSYTVVGSIPSGLSLSSTGELTGLPYVPGTFSITVKVTDSHALTASAAFQITIAPSELTVTTSRLPPGLLGRVYAAGLSVTGGTGEAVWSVGQGSLPPGITLSAGGTVQGTPTASGNFPIIVKVTDAASKVAAMGYTLRVEPSLVKPVVTPASLGSVFVGQLYSFTPSADNYPAKFAAVGLPAGIVYAGGIISGRASIPGVYLVRITASNAAGTSLPVTLPLVVKALPIGMAGTYIGYFHHQLDDEDRMEGRIDLTLSATGAYTLKYNHQTKTSRTVKGFMSPGINLVPLLLVNGQSLLFAIQVGVQPDAVTGNGGSFVLKGWRQTWHSTARPATEREGYYSMSLSPPSGVGIPQGKGFASFSVSTGGTITISGSAGDGSAFTTAGFVGPEGQVLLYQAGDATKRTLTGKLSLTVDDQNPILENTISGQPFGDQIELEAHGKSVTPKSKGHIVLGLPAAGSATLLFSQGGLSSPAPNAFTYTPSNSVLNLASPAKLSINKNTGLISGQLDATTKFRGIIVRPASGNSRAAGYFLRPQATGPKLSGSVEITQ